MMSRVASRFAWMLIAVALTGASNDDEFPRETLADSASGQRALVELRGRAATVLVSLSTECPISNEYLPTLNRLAERYRSRGVNFIGLNPSSGESLDDMRRHAAEHRLAFPFLKDEGGKVSRRLLIQVTPEARVFDPAGKIVYRGRIDDRYRAGVGSSGAAASGELEKALEEILAGKPVSVSRTRAVGCPVM